MSDRKNCENHNRTSRSFANNAQKTRAGETGPKVKHFDAPLIYCMNFLKKCILFINNKINFM